MDTTIIKQKNFLRGDPLNFIRVFAAQRQQCEKAPTSDFNSNVITLVNPEPNGARPLSFKSFTLPHFNTR